MSSKWRSGPTRPPSGSNTKPVGYRRKQSELRNPLGMLADRVPRPCRWGQVAAEIHPAVLEEDADAPAAVLVRSLARASRRASTFGSWRSLGKRVGCRATWGSIAGHSLTYWVEEYTVTKAIRCACFVQHMLSPR